MASASAAAKEGGEGREYRERQLKAPLASGGGELAEIRAGCMWKEGEVGGGFIVQSARTGKILENIDYS